MKVDGVEILVEGSGPETVVMVHGWPDTHRLWDRQVEALKGRYRCVRFTLPGFDAASERRAYSFDELMGFLKRVIEEVSPGQQVILLLHDWGCVFGYGFYARHPEMVSRIIGVDIGDSHSLRASLRPWAGLMIFGYQFWLALAWTIGGRAGDWMSRFMARNMRCPSPMADIGSRMNYPYFMLWFALRRSYRKEIRAFMPARPMLYIYAARKPVMFHAESWLEALRQRPGNQVLEFDTGHWVMTQEPERFNKAVLDWLAS